MGGINKTDADKYFKVGSHPAAALWNAANDEEREAAINFAKNQLERALPPVGGPHKHLSKSG